MSVQIYKDGKLTPVAGELYESGNVVPLANHANTANTANRAIADANGKDIATTFMPRGIDFKNGPFKALLPAGNTETWTVEEDCFMIAQVATSSPYMYLTIDGVNLSVISGNGSYVISKTVSVPVAKGQVISISSEYSYSTEGLRKYGDGGARFYRYIY